MKKLWVKFLRYCIVRVTIKYAYILQLFIYKLKCIYFIKHSINFVWIIQRGLEIGTYNINYLLTFRKERNCMSMTSQIWILLLILHLYRREVQNARNDKKRITMPKYRYIEENHETINYYFYSSLLSVPIWKIIRRDISFGKRSMQRKA